MLATVRPVRWEISAVLPRVLISLLALFVFCTGCTTTSHLDRSHALPSAKPGPTWFRASSGDAGSFEEALRRTPLDPAVVVAAAFEGNPGVAERRHQWRAETEEIGIAASLPDPMVRYGHFLESVESRVGPQKDRVMISQKLPFPGRFAADVALARSGARIARTRFEIAARDVVVAARHAYFELAYVTEAIRLTRGHRSLLDELVELVTAAHGAGQSTWGDVLATRAQRAQADHDLLVLSDLRVSVAAELNAVLGRPAGTLLGDPAALPIPAGRLPERDELRATARRNRLELVRERLEGERAEIDLRRARLGFWPDFTLGVTWIGTEERSGGMAVDGSGKDPWIFDVGITVPIWAGKHVARIRKARWRLRAAGARRAAEVSRLEAAVTRIHTRARTAARLTELYRDALLPQATYQLRAARGRAGEARGTGRAVLEAQGVVLNYQLALARAVADLHQHLARLEQQVGVVVTLRGEER